MVINKGFGLRLFGDLDIEGMAIEITLNDITIASINYEKGINNIETELFPFIIEDTRLTFPLDDFLHILKKAKQLAIKCAREDEELRKKGIDF
jgi:hypothetical protein